MAKRLPVLIVLALIGAILLLTAGPTLNAPPPLPGAESPEPEDAPKEPARPSEQENPAVEEMLEITGTVIAQDGSTPEPDPVVAAGSKNVRIVLDPLAKLTVKVVASPGGPDRPMTTFKVFDSTGKRVTSCMYQGKRPEGMGVDLRPGRRYRIEVAAAGYRQVGSGEVVLGANDLDAEVTIRIEPIPETEQVRLVLRLRDELTLPPGTSRLYFDRPHDAKPLTEPWLRTTLDVELEPGTEVLRDVTVRCGGWVRLFFQGSGGGNRFVSIGRAGEEPDRYALTEIEGGGFRPTENRVLAPGRYRASTELPGKGTVEREFVIRPCGITDVRFP